MKKGLLVCLVVMLLLPIFVHAQEPYTLPIDFSSGNAPMPEAFTESTYEDETISVSMERYRERDADIHVARITIKSPTQLRTALAGSFGSERTNKTSNLAAQNNAVVAMNGDYYSNRSAGYVVRQGETYRKKPVKGKDLLIIDDLGDFHILINSDAEKLQAILESDRTIINSFTFGPALVVDGELQEMPKKYEFNIHGTEPRSAIGQLDTLTYVLVVVDGRTKQSEGLSVGNLADFMQRLGCTQAFNLDGGNTATLIFNNDFYSTKTAKNERSISDIIYFASALPGDGAIIAE